jgi:hypothetical protein
VGTDRLGSGERRWDDSLAPPVGSPMMGGGAAMGESLHNVRQVQAQMIRGERSDLEGKRLTNLTGTAWHRITGGCPYK